MLDTELLIGTTGWEHDEWMGDFYPDDLPDDWRLGFYSNRLRSVLVPASDWQFENAKGEQADLVEWLDDIYPEFRMVLECKAGNENFEQEAKKLLERFAPIAENVDAFLVTIEIQVNDEIIRGIKILSEEKPVVVSAVESGEIADDSPVFEIDGVSRCWLADTQDKPAPHGSFLLAVSNTGDLKAARKIIENIDKWPENKSDVKGAALFFLGANAANNAVQARTIAELMGV